MWLCIGLDGGRRLGLAKVEITVLNAENYGRLAPARCLLHFKGFEMNEPKLSNKIFYDWLCLVIDNLFVITDSLDQDKSLKVGNEIRSLNKVLKEQFVHNMWQMLSERAKEIIRESFTFVFQTNSRFYVETSMSCAEDVIELFKLEQHVLYAFD
jgi:hypothetical protein